MYKRQAQGLTRAKEQYGNRSILLLKGWNPEMTRTMGAFGGFTNFWDTNSYGSWSKTPFVIGFHHDNMQDQTINDRYDLRNCETIVMMAMNPAWSAAGSQMWNYWQDVYKRQVIIAAAGKAAHLGGVVAAFTPLPVIAVPMKTSDLGGLDSLLSMVQMPSGVPVACVAINGAKNAAILAVQMMGTNDEVMLQKVADLKAEMAS